MAAGPALACCESPAWPCPARPGTPLRPRGPQGLREQGLVDRAGLDPGEPFSETVLLQSPRAIATRVHTHQPPL